MMPKQIAIPLGRAEGQNPKYDISFLYKARPVVKEVFRMLAWIFDQV
jgi:hypothetical protein